MEYVYSLILFIKDVLGIPQQIPKEGADQFRNALGINYEKHEYYGKSSHTKFSFIIPTAVIARSIVIGFVAVGIILATLEPGYLTPPCDAEINSECKNSNDIDPVNDTNAGVAKDLSKFIETIEKQLPVSGVTSNNE